ncbi:MAG: hypothetical protein Q4F11_06200, partial [Eubacteriales bacterium]|nr:hypothetical protein [Eubacteriales bacterium]
PEQPTNPEQPSNPSADKDASGENDKTTVQSGDVNGMYMYMLLVLAVTALFAGVVVIDKKRGCNNSQN